MKKWKQTLLAALLILSFLLSGCHIMTFSQRVEELESVLNPTQGSSHNRPDSQKPGKDDHSGNNEKPDHSDSPDTPPTQGKETLSHEYNEYVPYEDFEREYEPFLEQIPFSEMEYVSPDSEPILKGYEAVQSMVEAGTATAAEIIDAYEEVFEKHLFFDTMHSLSYIRYSLDLSNSYYDEEYNRCEELSPLLSQAQEKCFVAMSRKPPAQGTGRRILRGRFFPILR